MIYMTVTGKSRILGPLWRLHAGLQVLHVYVIHYDNDMSFPVAQKRIKMEFRQCSWLVTLSQLKLKFYFHQKKTDIAVAYK